MSLTKADLAELESIRAQFAGIELDFRLLRLKRAFAKAFDPQQPRTPAGHGRESGRWTREGEPGDAPEAAINSHPRLSCQPPYLIESYDMGPQTICRYQGWPDTFAVIIPRGACEPTYIRK
jgi:hypothetical protein